VILGSDDLVADGMFKTWRMWLEEGVEYMGIIDTLFYQPPDDHVLHWSGYPKNTPRVAEPVGSGRCVTRTLLDKLNWTLWLPQFNRGLDFFMTERLRSIGAFPRVCRMAEANAWHVDVKTKVNVTPLEPFVPGSKREPCTVLDDRFGVGTHAALLKATRTP
jgi:hypothetical protein